MVLSAAKGEGLGCVAGGDGGGGGEGALGLGADRICTVTLGSNYSVRIFC